MIARDEYEALEMEEEYGIKLRSYGLGCTLELENHPDYFDGLIVWAESLDEAKEFFMAELTITQKRYAEIFKI